MKTPTNTLEIKERKHVIESHCIEGKASVLDEDDALLFAHRIIDAIDNLNGDDPYVDPLLDRVRKNIISARNMNSFQGNDFVAIAEHLENGVLVRASDCVSEKSMRREGRNNFVRLNNRIKEQSFKTKRAGCL